MYIEYIQYVYERTLQKYIKNIMPYIIQGINNFFLFAIFKTLWSGKRDYIYVNPTGPKSLKTIAVTASCTSVRVYP